MAATLRIAVSLQLQRRFQLGKRLVLHKLCPRRQHQPDPGRFAREINQEPESLLADRVEVEAGHLAVEVDQDVVAVREAAARLAMPVRELLRFAHLDPAAQLENVHRPLADERFGCARAVVYRDIQAAEDRQRTHGGMRPLIVFELDDRARHRIGIRQHLHRRAVPALVADLHHPAVGMDRGRPRRQAEQPNAGRVFAGLEILLPA
ncbi:MAG: hypothetical protein KA383_05230 [Phycisphaerae bacterium]|nr:hypothetical protein [Phycisphaerae bacterium]